MRRVLAGAHAVGGTGTGYVLGRATAAESQAHALDQVLFVLVAADTEWNVVPRKTDLAMVRNARGLAWSWVTSSTLVNRLGGMRR